jgi:hypothetical protein
MIINTALLTRQQIGEQMIHQGQLSEWHQQMIKREANSNDRFRHMEMYGYHHAEYLRLKELYKAGE